MTNIHPINKMAATQQALSMPEILAQIFVWVSEDTGIWTDHAMTEENRRHSPDLSDSETEYQIDCYGVLVRCALVNSQWHDEAMRVLWNHWQDSCFCPRRLVDVFEKIDPARRQKYANFISQADLFVIEEDDRVEVAEKCFEGIIFPNLEHLLLQVPGGAHGDDKIDIIPYGAPRLVTLEIDPRFEIYPDMYGVFQEEWEKIFELIPVGLFFSALL